MKLIELISMQIEKPNGTGYNKLEKMTYHPTVNSLQKEFERKYLVPEYDKVLFSTVNITTNNRNQENIAIHSEKKTVNETVKDISKFIGIALLKKNVSLGITNPITKKFFPSKELKKIANTINTFNLSIEKYYQPEFPYVTGRIIEDNIRKETLIPSIHGEISFQNKTGKFKHEANIGLNIIQFIDNSSEMNLNKIKCYKRYYDTLANSLSGFEHHKYIFIKNNL